MGLQIDPAELIRKALDSRAQDIWTSFPAKVLAYDPGSDDPADPRPPTVEVDPQIRRPVPSGEDGDVEFETLPVLPNVPVQFPRGSGDSIVITWPLSPGDFVWIHVCTNSIGEWRRTGEPSDTGDVRAHSLNSCFAVPGAAPNSKPLGQAGINALVLEAPSILLGKEATVYVALQDLVEGELTKIKNALASATAPPGGGPVTYGTPYTSVGNTGASQVKAK